MSMNVRNELQALDDVHPTRDLWADALARVGSGERFRPPHRKLSRASLAAGVVLAAALAAIAATVLSRSSPPALTGATIHLAGYHFRTPAGFTASSSACPAGGLLGNGFGIPPGPNAFTAAGSAAGGCVEASFFGTRSGSPIPPNAQPVDVGAYQGYLVQDELLQLLVYAPAVGGADAPYLVLTTNDLTGDQLVAIALSGLPASP